jgi:stearoyl-CoA desaturase (delta-9 desaturase)
MKTKAWHRSIGALCFPLVLWLSLVSNASIGLFLLAFLIYLSISITVTSGYHRLFTHSFYQCHKLWHWVYGFIGTISLNSSPVEWSTVHIAHHKHSDTEDDPYDTSFKHFFRFKDRNNIKPTKNEIRLLKDPMHKFFMNNSLTLSVVFGIITMLCGFQIFLFVYALPVSLYLVTSGLHTIYAHDHRGAKNLWFMEFLIPMAGEWIHKEHHDNPRRHIFNHKPHYFDLGGFFINLIKYDKPTT